MKKPVAADRRDSPNLKLSSSSSSRQMAFPRLHFTIGTGPPERSKYGGKEASDVKRLKDLEEENARLKNEAAQADVCRSGNGQRLGPATKRQLAEEIVREQAIPVSRACQLLSLPRSQFYFNTRKDDTAEIEVLQDLAFAHPFGWGPETVRLYPTIWPDLEGHRPPV